MVATGTLIWISVRPLLRLIFCVSCGFAITKADIFPATAAAGAGQMLLNITLPSLMFSKIVPAFTSDNVGALGPLVLIALIYEAMGILLSYTVKQLFWVPHRFRYGILVAGGWSNIGDIPTSVILSVTGAMPFAGVADQNLAVAYISAFILVFMLTLFPFGGHKWVAWDFVGPDVEPEEVQEAMRIKRAAIFKALRLTRRRSTPEDHESAVDVSEKAEQLEQAQKEGEFGVKPNMHPRHVSFMVDDASTMVPTEGVASPGASRPPMEASGARVALFDRSATLATNLEDSGKGTDKKSVATSTLPVTSRPSSPQTTTKPSRLCFIPRIRVKLDLHLIVDFFKAAINPASLAILIAFPIALIPVLKALFVQVPGTNIPAAPDGQPPLAFLLDATTFVGAASVPLGLICLGSSLARLPVPRKGQWSRLPLGAISWLAVGKLLVIPVLGVLMCEGFTRAGLISRDDKVLRLVCIFISCLPTATTQVLLTQVYSGTGSAEHLAPFLIPQYILMIVAMPALIAYTLQLLF
ncbi:hypothetical protein D9619_004550 [Psilocybe cf. subviscida]|uniref:Auxin efflux carrier n=1 Tax=Psilocybe cf. subviscida TaxID=2480587 RepID=A0A8H5BRJ9_9AGAR|nr:hypothetical protein D9619_004550 [Psilocybe cf. subviscida]